MQSQRIPGSPKELVLLMLVRGRRVFSGVGVLLSQVGIWDLAQSCVNSPVEHTQGYEVAVFIELWKTVLTVQ